MNWGGAWHVYALEVSEEGTLFAATEPAARVFRSRTGGLTWTECATLPGASGAFSLLAAADGSLYVGTYPEGRVFRSTDEGRTWSATARIPDATHVRALVELDGGVVMAGVTADGPAVFASRDQGVSWRPTGELHEMETGVRSLYYTAAGAVLCGGLEGSVHYSTDGGMAWNEAFIPGDGRNGVRAESFLERADGTLFMGGFVHAKGARVWTSDDGGRGWQQTTLGEIQFEAANGDSLRAVHGFALAETDDGELLLGTEPGVGGVVLRSLDDGASWHREGVLSGAFQGLCMTRLPGGAILVGTTPNGDVFRWNPSGRGGLIGLHEGWRGSVAPTRSARRRRR